MSTLEELRSQREHLDQLLYATWLRERETTRQRIVDLALEFGLSPATVAKDIEAAQKSAPEQQALFQAPKVELPLRNAETRQYVEPKYRNARTGETWTGRGMQPRWLREAIDAGSALEEFRIDRAGGDAGPAVDDPLRQFQDAARRARRPRHGRP